MAGCQLPNIWVTFVMAWWLGRRLCGLWCDSTVMGWTSRKQTHFTHTHTTLCFYSDRTDQDRIMWCWHISLLMFKSYLEKKMIKEQIWQFLPSVGLQIWWGLLSASLPTICLHMSKIIFFNWAIWIWFCPSSIDNPCDATPHKLLDHRTSLFVTLRFPHQLPIQVHLMSLNLHKNVQPIKCQQFAHEFKILEMEDIIWISFVIWFLASIF